ncbi:hypothetical protein KC351_g1136 [Hortaea werneckii]|nr:hypothetical protein KC351_g1136 [Hortaea werneckii]
MLDFTKSAVLLLATATTFANAQFGGGNFGGGGGGNPYDNGGDNGNSGNSNGGNGFGGDFSQFIPDRYHTMIIAHAVLATLAFALFFPVGGIMIRLASFPGLWWIHGLFQIFAYILYIAAFAIGVYMATSSPNGAALHNAHPIIGIVLFVLLFFQPFLGFLHHVMFKKHSRRVVWSYGHIWLGRAIITLGIINGGLGLQWAKRTGAFAPSTGAIIAYGVIAGLIWLVYIISAIYGEVKRRRGSSAKGNINPPPGWEDGRSYSAFHLG